MPALKLLVSLLILADLPAATDDSPSADALYPESVRSAIAKLDDPDFRNREQAVDDLYTSGFTAISALRDVAESGSPEVSVRAVNILQRLYQIEDEPTFETIEQIFFQLKHVENLSVTARAERAFDSLSEIRQKRAIRKLEQLGGIIHYSDQNPDRQAFGHPRIEYVMLERGWAGGEAGLRLLERIDDIRLSDMATLYIIRGVEISNETLLNLKAELPNLHVQRRGPAKLGVVNERGPGCIIKAVEPLGAADRAGLQSGDQILEIDKQKIATFEELVEIVGNKDPGDQVPIVFRRAGETRDCVAELSGWKK